MDYLKKIWQKTKQPLIYGLIIFFLGGFGGLVVQKYVAPFLSAKPVLGKFGFLRPDSPIVITKTEQVRVNEGVNLVELVKQVTPKIVTIIGGRGEIGNGFAEAIRGSGVIISSDGVMATDASIFADKSQNFTAVTTDGKVYPVDFLASDPKSGLALVKIDDGTLSSVEFGFTSGLEVAQQAVILSGTETKNLSSLKMSYISSAPGDEKLSDTYSSEDYKDNFKLDLKPGAGEGVFNLRGQLIGIGTHSNGIIPVEIIRTAQDSYFANQQIIRPYLGIRYSIITQAGAEISGLPVKEGVLLVNTAEGTAVVPGSPGDKAGLHAGDIISKINNESVTSKHELDFFLNRSKPGEIWNLTVLREGEELNIKVELGELR